MKIRVRTTVLFLFLLVALVMASCASLDTGLRALVDRTESLSYQRVFESKRGFGADHTDIYSFSVPEGKKSPEWESLDERYRGYVREFKAFLDDYSPEEGDKANKDFDAKNVLSDLQKIEEAGDGVYKSLKNDKEGRMEIFVYSAKLNQGFYFDSKI